MGKYRKRGATRRVKRFFRDIRRLPQSLRSESAAVRRDAHILLACMILVIAALGLGVYAAGWYVNRGRIMDDADRYRQMYAGGLAAPTATAAEVSATPAPEATLEPMDTLAPEETLAPLSTPDADTLVYALPTAPPVQSSFAELILHNPDTVGYLDIEGVISLPVVQRQNDNEFYLDHNFDGAEGSEGALFLDGANLLVPEDDCLIIYGHNMKNDTMFGRLEDYEDMAFLREHAVIRFDTIYENRLYVPFAAFTASMDEDDSRYFDVRQFIFDETSFDLFTLRMQTRSIYDIPVDVQYGDRLLLLVTCDYTSADGRFVLCLRQLRDGEREEDMRALVAQAAAN